MIDAHPGTFAFVQYHLSDGYQTPWGDQRANVYGVSAIPTSYFDGVTVRVGAYDYYVYNADYTARRAVMTPVTIDLSTSPGASGTVTVQARVCLEAGAASKTLRIYIVQVLDHWPAENGYHRNGFKQAAATEDISLSAGQYRTIQRTFTLDAASWADQGNARIIAWAELAGPSGHGEVYQAAVLPGPFVPDCNHNGIDDALDITSGTSPDCNANGLPDECEVPPLGPATNDCNGNHRPDDCDIAAGVCTDCNADGVPDECEIVAERGADFDRFYAWAAFDPGAQGVGTDPDGFSGAVFDGRYVYFVPNFSGADYDGEVLRYDTSAAFASASSWASYDPGAHGVGTDPDGYSGGVFDGRYVYFVPSTNGTAYHGEVLRFDSRGAFADAASWGAYDPGAHGVGTDPDGYAGAVFDGRYLYFAPRNNGTIYHGEVLRYDTQGPFAAATSWTAYDAGAHGVGTDPDGYSGVVFDGRYLYFAPFHNGSAYSGEVLRYDTTMAFADAAAWATFDAHASGVGRFAVGFEGAVCDGRFVYFVPFRDAFNHYHGEVLRYDTAADFQSTGAWKAFEPGTVGVGTVSSGYCGGVCAGRYVFLAPYLSSVGYHGEVLRYDTTSGWDCNGNGVLDDCDLAAGIGTDLNRDGILDGCEGLGDTNCDGATNFDDINPFVLALVGRPSYASEYPTCRWLNGDCNGDGLVNFDDIAPFVQRLTQP